VAAAGAQAMQQATLERAETHQTMAAVAVVVGAADGYLEPLD